GVVHAGHVVDGHTHLAGLSERMPVGTDGDGAIITLGQAARTVHLLQRARTAGVLTATQGMAQLRTLIDAGDPAATELAAQVARALAHAAAGAVALLDPQAIILGGENLDLVRAAGPVFDDTLRSAVAPAQRDLVVRALGEEFDEW